jgi:ADP-ribose pyrophosphatase YjhB (NUDIX family)
MHVDEALLAPVRVRFGKPVLMRWDGDVTAEELALATYNPARTHDVTLFVFNGRRLALIRKPHFVEGVWRPPGGGIREGEDFVAGVEREGFEELGVAVELDRYLVRAEAEFRHGDRALAWTTHVFSAATGDERLAPTDTAEIAAAR